METKVGLWVDHREAVIVIIDGARVETRLILSDIEKQLRRSGDSPLKGPFEAQIVPAEDSQEAKFNGSLTIFYDEVIANIGEARSILLFGPGIAKDELKKRLASHNREGRIVGIETTDKMTENQIKAKVTRYFQECQGG